MPSVLDLPSRSFFTFVCLERQKYLVQDPARFLIDLGGTMIANKRGQGRGLKGRCFHPLTVHPPHQAPR